MNGAHSRFCLSLVLSAIALTAARANEPAVRLNPRDITNLAQGGAGAGTSGVAGIRTATLLGDPTKPGPYTIEIQVPAFTLIAAHTHRDDRSAVVVSGHWYFGYGAVHDVKAAKSLPPGSFYTEPGGAPHFAFTRDEPAVVYISGMGPTDTRYTEGRAPSGR